MKKRLSLLIASSLFANTAYADPLLQKAKLWTAIDFKGSLTENIQYYLEPQLRLISRSPCFDEANMYVGLGYPATPKVTLWLGNMFITSHKVDNGNTQQYRIWEQISWDVLGNDFIQIDSRTRLEQRKQEHQASWALRVRERVSLSFPLNRSGYFFVLYDEIFLNANHPSWVSNAFLSQNRAFAGFSIPVGKSTHLETGYLNQYVVGSPDQLNHVLSFVLRVRDKPVTDL